MSHLQWNLTVKTTMGLNETDLTNKVTLLASVFFNNNFVYMEMNLDSPRMTLIAR